MLKIRLARLGTKQRPFYRVVVIDERSKRSGVYLELLGTYNPLTTPHEVKLKQDRIDHWVKMGAQMSDGFLRIIGKAKQRLPRKPKKAAKETPAAPAPEAQPTVETPTETAPQEATEQPAETQPVVETPTEAPAEEVKTESNETEASAKEEQTATVEEVTEGQKE